jgi:hypothetical protein
MRARNTAALAIAALALLAFGVGLLARPRGARTSSDERPSTFLAGPGGARGLLEATRALGIEVRRFRERPRELTRLADGTPQLFAIIGPSVPFSAPERTPVLSFNRQADLLLAGESAEQLMRCYGYRVKRRVFDSLPALPPRSVAGPATPWVRAELEATHERVYTDSARLFDVGRSSCTVPPIRAIDTLLASRTGRPVALRLLRADLDRRVILLADEELLRNRSLRRTDAGPFALRLVQGRYRRVVFEEYHHGFGAQGSLAGAALDWSRHSPWGWVAWQLALVGLLALLFGAIRFGPARPGIARVRRSPLEHVRALAVALSAARGHDEAIGAIVRGLRRRLSVGTVRSAGSEWREWLGQLDRGGLTPGAQEALARLGELTRPEQPSASVLRAANAVEDLWQELRP